MMEAQNVYLIDDQPSVRKAMSRLLQSEGVNAITFESAEAFFGSGYVRAAGCLVVDLAMPSMDGMLMQKKLTEIGCILPVIFLTGHGSIETSVIAMKMGAQDFLTKPVDADKLLAAIRIAFERNRISMKALNEKQTIQTRLNNLSPRELEVMHLIIEGKLNKQVAAELGIVEKTVKVHRANVMRKLEVRSIAALMHLLEKVKT